MTIGYTEEEDPRTPEQLRGDMEKIRKAALSVGDKATVKGIATEIEALKQQLEMTHEQMRNLIGIYGTLQREFRQFQMQRVVELQGRGTGSTTPEDGEDGA